MLHKTSFADTDDYLAYLRDWFAGQALAASYLGGSEDFIARQAYRFADAMMKAREG